MKNFDQIIAEIKSLKIQGAMKVAKAGLEALLMTEEKNWSKAIKQLIAARSTEPMLQNCLKLVELRGKKGILDLFVKLDKLEEEITRNGLVLIKNGMTILTHCHSSTVINLLIKVSRLRQGYGGQRKFKVYLTETRPLMQGRITAEELVKADIEATMITDSEAATLVSKEDNKDVDLVFLGTDAILADGSIINKVGSYGIALAADKAGVPVYVLASLLKFSNSEVKIEERRTEEIWQDKPRGLAIFNPAFDKVPRELIKGIICEFGIIKPEKAKDAVRKNYPWITENKIRGTNCHCEERSDEAIFMQPNDKIAASFASLTPRNDIRTSPYKHYLHLGEKIDKKNHLLAQFLLKAEQDQDFLEISGGVAAESSVGTWTEVTTQFKKTWEKLHARILEADEKSGQIKIAYPLELFEKGNLAQLLSSVAGNIYGLKEVARLKLVDLEMPEKYIRSFPGPALGIGGIRKISGIRERPLIGCIIKPKLGLNYQEHAQVAKKVFEGGVDFVKDDENLTSQVFNPFEKRVKAVMDILRAKREVLADARTVRKIYAFNVTQETETMLKRANLVKDHGGNCVMIDFLTAGFSALQSLRQQNLGLIIHGHRAMHAALTRLADHGLSMLVLAKLVRLAGVDSLHTGTVVGKMEGGEKEVLVINNFLRSEWFGLKTVLPVASGGLHPGMMVDLVRILGKEMMFNFGGGIHGHPRGSKAGAMAVRQALSAVEEKISLAKFAERHQELKEALEHWS